MFIFVLYRTNDLTFKEEKGWNINKNIQTGKIYALQTTIIFIFQLCMFELFMIFTKLLRS